MSITATGSEINGFETDLFNPAGGATTGSGNTSTGTGLNVALSSDTPAATTVPSGATGVVATNFNVTASNDGAIVLDSMVVTRSGIGDEAKIDKVYLYDGSTRLTTGRSISDSTQTASFSNINYTVAAGTTKTLSIVMDVASSASGEHRLGIASASAIDASGATVSGSFPVTGNIMSLSSTAIGQVDVEENNTGTTSDTTYDYTAYAGESNVEIAKFNVDINSTEDAALESLTFYNAGRDVVENLELYRGSDLVAYGVVSGDYITFELTTPYEMEKGNNAQFTIMADIVDARAADDVKLYIRYKTDVRVMGATYGYYLDVADHTGSVSSTSMIDPLVTTVQVAKTNIEAGQVTFTNTGTPLTNNVAKNSNDVALLDFNITAQTAVDVEKVGVILIDSDNDDTDDDLSNLELVCDGSVKSEWADPTEASAGTAHTDTSVWTIAANDTVNCTIRVDIENTKGTEDVSANVDISNWTFKDSSTGDTITDIIPSADLTGNTMSVVAASVTGAIAAVPTAQTWVAGQTFEVNGFNFAAGDAEAVTITSLTVTGYYDEDGGADDFLAGGSSGAMKDVVSSVELYVDGVQIGTTQTLSTAGVATFNTLNWDIAAGATEKVVVKVNTAKGSVDADDDNVKFTVSSASAEYTSDGTTLSAVITAIDEVGESTVYQTVTDSGSITAALASDTPDSDLLIMGTEDVVMTKVKFSATNEDFVVEKLQVSNASASDDEEYLAVKVRYTDSNGVVQTATGSFSGDTANFSGLDIFVEKDEDAVVELLATLNTSTGGAANNTTTALDLTTAEFRAIAQGSGTVDSTGDAVLGNDMYVFKSVPTVEFAEDTPSGDLLPNASDLLAKVDITASANEDITFEKDTDANTITFQVATSGAVMGTLTLKDSSGNTLDTATNSAGEYEFDFTDNSLTVGAGTTETLSIFGDTTGFSTAGDTVQVWLDDVDADISWGINGSGSYGHGSIIFKGELYGGAQVKP
jgi:hypothetical protein